MEEKLDGNYTRMLRAILNKSLWQHPINPQLYGHLAPITKTIQVRRTRHAGHSWRSREELISDVHLWTALYGRAKAGRPARTCIQQLCEDTRCNPEDLPEAMNDREQWREMVRNICASGMRWWWWWWWDRIIYVWEQYLKPHFCVKTYELNHKKFTCKYIYIYIYIYVYMITIKTLGNIIKRYKYDLALNNLWVDMP